MLDNIPSLIINGFLCIINPLESNINIFTNCWDWKQSKLKFTLPGKTYESTERFAKCTVRIPMMAYSFSSVCIVVSAHHVHHDGVEKKNITSDVIPTAYLLICPTMATNTT